MARNRPIPAAHWSATPIARVIGPMQSFISQSVAGGIILLVAAVVALVIANSPLAEAYFALLETKVGFVAGSLEFTETILHWVNDGLMAIFFFLVGLEIKREITVGELSSPRAAALPILAATGGALVPAGIYLAFNAGRSGVDGWGIPMATDIAFALGCLAILGNRVPFTLKIFLTAVAIVDDLIAVLVIALFYTSGLNGAALGMGALLLVLLLVANLFGIRSPLVYAGVGVLIWLAFLESGVHATIAGVLIAFTVPARYRIDVPTFLARAHAILDRFESDPRSSAQMITDEQQQSAVLELEEACEQVQAPLQKIEHALQPWVALVIMPIFALANAGVPLSMGGYAADELSVLAGIVLGLVVGKLVGLSGTVWLVVRSGLSELPHGVSWPQMIGVSLLAGIGFTMSIFIATLAFDGSEILRTAKVAILLASVIAGTAGLLFLRAVSRPAIAGELAEGEAAT